MKRRKNPTWERKGREEKYDVRIDGAEGTRSGNRPRERNKSRQTSRWRYFGGKRRNVKESSEKRTESIRKS